MPLGVVYITGEILLEKNIFFHSFVSSYALEIDSGVYLGPYIFSVLGNNLCDFYGHTFSPLSISLYNSRTGTGSMT